MHRALVVSLAFLLLFVTGCAPVLSSGQSQQLTGSGNLVTQEFSFDKADRLLAASNFQVALSPGEKVSVKVTADDNIMESVYVHVSNGELRLELKPGRAYNTNKVTLKADVAMPVPGAVTLQDNATANLGDVRASELALKLTGNGIVTAKDMSAARMNLSGDGNAQARLSGAVAELTLDGKGNTLATCPDLQVHTAKVTLRNNAMAALKVTDKLDYNLSGNAGLSFTGSPQLGEQQRRENATVSQR